MCYHYTTQKRFPFIDFIIYCILCLKCLICLFYFRILCWPSSLGGFKLCTMLLFNHHYFSFPENSLLKNKIKMSHLLFLFFPFYQGAFFFKRSWAWLVEIPRTDIASAQRLGCNTCNHPESGDFSLSMCSKHIHDKLGKLSLYF